MTSGLRERNTAGPKNTHARARVRGGKGVGSEKKRARKVGQGNKGKRSWGRNQRKNKKKKEKKTIKNGRGGVSHGDVLQSRKRGGARDQAESKLKDRP